MTDARRKLLIDTDTASDDAVALLMALRDPTVEVIAITVVAGNVPLELAVQNALYTVELAGVDVPVYVGAATPLLEPLHTAQVVHGNDGMGDIGLPLTGRVPAEGDAVDRLIELIDAHEPGELTLVTLGPLTNIAVLFARRPDLATRLREVVMMAGTSDGLGNITAAAEFNVWVDPEAAAMVFRSGADLAMVGWDISRKYATFDADQAAPLGDDPERHAMGLLPRIRGMPGAVQVQDHVVPACTLRHRLDRGVADHQVDHDDLKQGGQ